MKTISKMAGIVLTAGLVTGLGQAAAADEDLQFFFPVAVGGKAATTIDELTAEYVKQTPGVKIDAVYAGSYQDTITKVLTAVRGGNPPQLSVILAVDMFTLIEEDAIELHLIAMSSSPAVYYWAPATLRVLECVRRLRSDGVEAFATMDAGANVHVICLPAAAATVGAAGDAQRYGFGSQRGADDVGPLGNQGGFRQAALAADRFGDPIGFGGDGPQAFLAARRHGKRSYPKVRWVIW